MVSNDSGRIRSCEEQCRVQERLLLRGNTLGVVVASALELLAAGRSLPETNGIDTQTQLEGLAQDLRSWTADVRAVASEEAP